MRWKLVSITMVPRSCFEAEERAGMKNGAVGGKLVGAGGGGFLLFYSSDRDRLCHAMAKAGLEEVRFRFDFEGTKIVLS